MKQNFLWYKKGVIGACFAHAVGIFSGEANEEYQPVELVLNDKVVHNEHYLLLYLMVILNRRLSTKKALRTRAKFKVTTEMPEAFQSDCGEQIKDASSVSYY